MKYQTYLKNKNLSKNTIRIYLQKYKNWKSFLDEQKPTKSLIIKYINFFSKNHEPNSIRVEFYAIISILKFEKNWKLINLCRDIKLPKIQQNNKTIITLNEFYSIESKIKIKSWKEKRNWLIFCFLFFTGVRVSELLLFNKNKIFDSNRLKIIGKGNKERIIFLPNYLLNLLKNWKHSKIAISKKNKIITTKQINLIIKELSIKLFNKKITPHALRRSFATNLLKNKANIEIIRKTLGHSNINTTARYLNFNDDEIIDELNNILNRNNK